MLKRITKLIIILILIGIIFYLLWQIVIPKPKLPSENKKDEILLPSKAVEDQTQKENNTTKNETTTSKEEKNKDKLLLVKISNFPVLNYWFDKNAQKIKYISLEGKVFDAFSNPNNELSSEKIINILDVKPYQDGSKVLIAYKGTKKISWIIYNSNDDSISPLPSNIINAFWGDKNDRIFAIIDEMGIFSLIEINLNQNLLLPKIIVKNFNFYDADFNFLPPSLVIITEKTSPFTKTNVWVFDINKNTINKIFTSEDGSFVKIAENKNLIYYSQNENLGVLKIDSLETTEIPLQTLPNKCDLNASSSLEKIICFGIQNIYKYDPIDKKYVNNYLKKAIYTLDRAYIYNFKTKDTVSVFVSGKHNVPIDATEVKFIEGSLYFINRYDQNLYKLTVPEFKEF